MDFNKRLETLLLIIKKQTGLNSKEISKALGYHHAHISQRLSNRDTSKRMVTLIEEKYAEHIKAYEQAGGDQNILNEDAAEYIRRKPGNDKIIIQQGIARIYECVHRIEVRETVTRNFIAEIYAKVFERPSASVIVEMEEMEKKLAQGPGGGQ